MPQNNSIDFRPAPWLKNAHLQTLWPSLCRLPVAIDTEWERIELPDGDFIDLVWEGKKETTLIKPVILLLHGLGGNIESTYVKGFMRALKAAGYKSVLMHFRGASGVPNRLARGYHSGNTPDVAFVVDLLMKRYPRIPFGAVGVSLGANVLLKWLGERGEENPLKAAIAISVPFQLGTVANRLMHGFSRVYQWKLIRQLKQEIRVKFQTMPCPFDLSKLDKVKTFWEFDDLVTAPLHGFSGVDEYYRVSSSYRFLPHISKPALIIHALDDPFMEPDVIPSQSQLSASTTLHLTEHGGHVGFVEGPFPFFETYWLERTIPIFLSQYL